MSISQNISLCLCVKGKHKSYMDKNQVEYFLSSNQLVLRDKCNENRDGLFLYTVANYINTGRGQERSKQASQYP